MEQNSIFDKKLLDERKKQALSHMPRKRKIVQKEEKKKPRWFELPITMDCFIKKTDKNGKIYAKHNAWKDTIWIGPYDNEETLDKVLKSYIANSKKSALERKDVKNFHSVLMHENDW